MELITVKLTDLTPHPENYNTHPEEQLTELEKSLGQFAQFKNIVINPDYVVLAGHGLVEAAKRKGIGTLDAYIFVGTTEQEKALLLADNATPFLALPDADKLNDLLESFPSLDDIPGITDDWLAQFQIQVEKIVDIDFDSDEAKIPVIKIEVSELEYDSLRRDITGILKGYETPKFV